MTTHATAASPSSTAARRYSESLSVLVTRPAREVLVGLAIIDATPGTRPREGEVIRDMIDEAISALYTADPDRYGKAVRKGRAALRQRDAAKRSGE